MSTAKIGPRYLARLALVYVRQSSPGQVRGNRESTARQYSLAERGGGVECHFMPVNQSVFWSDYGMARSHLAALTSSSMHLKVTFSVDVAYNSGNSDITMRNRKRSFPTSVLKLVVTIGLDLAKNSVFFVGLDASGQVRTRRQYSKAKLLAVTSTMSPCRIGMEACCGAHHLGRTLAAQGHDVRLMPPKYVKPFVKRDKNDAKDAEACAEACLRPTMRFVAVKSEEQLAMQSVHRHRSRLVGNSTQLVNQARAFLLERGIALPKSKRKFAERLPEILEDADNGLPDAVRELLGEMLEEWGELEGRIAKINRCLQAEAKANEACRRLLEVPGIGPQTATALVATIDSGNAFEKGRDFAAWLGLTPRESSTGGRQRLGRISKRGNKYLRTLLVHCARSSLNTLSKRQDRPGAWLRRQLENKERNVVIVALAARLARIAWALLNKGERFAPEPEVAPAG